MPEIKNFKNDSKKTEVEVEAGEAKNKRRPGRDPETAEAEMKVVDVDTAVENSTEATFSPQSEAQFADKTEEVSSSDSSAEEASEQNKIEINFPGSEILRAQFPQSFKVADAVVTDWVNDGSFDSIPLDNPTAQLVAARGLQKAKEIEKKVMASPVTEKLMMQALQVGMKAMAQVEEIKAKLNRK